MKSRIMGLNRTDFGIPARLNMGIKGGFRETAYRSLVYDCRAKTDECDYTSHSRATIGVYEHERST